MIPRLIVQQKAEYPSLHPGAGPQIAVWADTGRRRNLNGATVMAVDAIPKLKRNPRRVVFRSTAEVAARRSAFIG